ncbi:MAG TPA: class I SAM-dependent methyltransferase [Longimicrobiales bacterium]|nr:class I SAM-dependent methyltransferase [Longimicrobiales bacterium]
MRSPGIPNAYDDRDRAAAYADLGFAGTYYLAFRDLPDLIARHGTGRKALDFGCGAGRSTRFLKELGLDTIGIDVAEPMLRIARERDPGGTYMLVRDDAVTGWPDGPFDLVLAAYPFDNIAEVAHRRRLLDAIGRRLAPDGRLIVIASAPELYTNEWLSFTTAYPENDAARTGDVVRIAITDGGDRRPILDVLWDDAAYRADFAAAGLDVLEMHRPLGRPDEPYAWQTELHTSPWLLYVLRAPSSG